MIAQISIKNDFVNIQNEKLDFSHTGVYILKGKNGAGKTSILENIVFGNPDVAFKNKKQEELYKVDRQKVITYIEQNPQVNNCTVKDYIYRCNDSVNVEEMERLIKLFKLEDISLSKKVNQLSGGEIIKLNIISGLLKETPYILMDEPTNNMDNESVRQFVSILNEIKHDKTIVLVTHDPRCVIEDAVNTEINDSKIKMDELKDKKQNMNECPDIKKPGFKLVLFQLKKRMSVLTTIFMTALFLFLFFINYDIMKYWYSLEELPNKKDLIVSYNVDLVYGELNKTYARSAGIEVDEERFNSFIRYDDLDELYSDDKIKRIVVSDEKYIGELAETIDRDKLDDSLHILSLPDDVVSEFGDVINLGVDIRYLKEGTLPREGQREVAVSTNILKKYFNYTDSDLTDVIGKKINLENVEYTITGVSYFDICIVSYTDDSQYGFFTFMPKKYEKNIEAIKKYLEDIDAALLNEPGNIFVYTEDNCEQKVLNGLIKKYPANNYTSYQFTKGFKNEYNSILNVFFIIGNLAVSVIIAVLLCIFYLKKQKLYAVEMRNLNVYYATKNLANRYFLISQIIQILFSLIVLLVIEVIFALKFKPLFGYMAMDFILLSLPSLLVFIEREKVA